MSKATEAKLVARSERLEIRHVTRKNQTWPGYHDCSPLGRCGYWVGTFERQMFADRGLSLDDLCRRYGCAPVPTEA